ncbi:alpha/beta fold hydrolase [Plectonema cf. radiosum LEGE 06105]|uniref:Alpha/beta fold hydrolase n=1 Tax=Plectonema cf. radiosum LEGE 06105 TaxID=945769 RepID=A0A8J7FJW4_9CYAN|nr:alpha/beta fold hydrolase [Plectonema radiosum]MBE9215171.1 alpha/beta fold hydrolase [Plectonema cf. radiosum LEGE 06105]
MRDYSTTTTAIIEQAIALEQTLPIKNQACSSKFFFHPHPIEKICLFFHGFTAGPYQFEPLGKALFAAGYNVMIPLQPGHGVAGNFDGDNPPPLPLEREVYQEYALSWLQTAQQLGNQVIVGGLSTGGTLAAWLALEYYQEIEKALLFSPYLNSKNAIINFVVEVLPIYYEWLNKDNPGNFGYKGFQIPALRLFLDMGQEILEQVKNNPSSPVFMITSESDAVVDRSDLKSLFESVRKKQPKSWYFCFDQLFEIPHTMMTELEGNNYVGLLNTVAKAYLESDITWHEVLKIGNEILQGKTFDNAVKDLNLQEKVTPDLSVMLSVMDKKVVVDFASK